MEKLFRVAAFNLLAHNRDDHSKNFAFLMDGAGRWSLAPAYDLTFSSGPGGQHSTLVSGQGNPTVEDLLLLADDAGIERRHALHVVEKTRHALSLWPTMARAHGVSVRTVQLVSQRIGR